jgi:hypothetical protein
VTPALVVAVLAVSLLLALWSGLLAARDVLYGKPFLQGMFALQALLVAQLAGVLVFLGGDERPAETTAFASYLVLSLLLVPASFGLALEEKTRYGTLVFTIVSLAIAVVETRLVATWS